MRKKTNYKIDTKNLSPEEIVKLIAMGVLPPAAAPATELPAAPKATRS